MSMRRSSMLVVALCATLGACAESRTSFVANTGPNVPVGVPDAAPSSFIDTCNRSPDLCGLPGAVALVATPAADMNVDATAGADSRPAALAEAGFSDDKALKALQAVNSEVNGVMARGRGLLVNAADQWAPATQTPNGLVGDCKSFAAEKRRRLIAAGFPADRLFYAVVFRADLGLHALLMAHLDRGDYALDSRQPWVTPWYEAPYVYVQRQTPGAPLRWTNLVAPQAAVAPILLAQNPVAAAISGAGSR
jgi:predicted transglutaminase-like cysteine proteinase